LYTDAEDFTCGTALRGRCTDLDFYKTRISALSDKSYYLGCSHLYDWSKFDGCVERLFYISWIGKNTLYPVAGGKEPAVGFKNRAALRLLDETATLLFRAKVGIMLVPEMLKVQATSRQ
jgi:hypothetical protein